MMKKVLLIIYLLLGITCSNLYAQWSELGAETGGLNANGTVDCVIADNVGNIYTAGRFKDSLGNSCVAKWDKNTNKWSILGSLGVNFNIYSLAIDNNSGNVYVGGNFYDSSLYACIYMWDKSTNLWNKLIPSYKIRGSYNTYAMNVDNGGNLFTTGSLRGIFERIPNTNFFYNQIDTLAGRIHSLDFDNSGNIYFGGTESVKKWDNTFKVCGYLGLSNNGISSVVVDKNAGYVYAANNYLGNGIIQKWDGVKWFVPDSLNSPNKVKSLALDANGNLYAYVAISDTNWVFKYDGNKWSKIVNPKMLLPNNSISMYSYHNICIDNTGNLYVVCNFSNNSGTTKYTVERYIPCTPTTSITNKISCGSYLWNGTTYSNSGTYIIHLANSIGCDSVATLNLTVVNITPTTQTVSVSGCNSVVYNGNIYTSSVIHRDTVRSYQSCDSVYIVATITVRKITPVTQTTTISGCNNVVYNGVSYSTSTVHTDTVKSYQGCDSIYKVAIIIINQVTPIIQNISVNGCNSVLYNGVTYSTSTIHTDTVKSYQGCDSIYKVATITVVPNNLAISITGVSNGGSICIGSKDTLGGLPAGGVWTSSNTNIATINSSNGIVLGFSTGTVSLYFTVSNNTGCTSMNVIAGGTTLPSISGVNNVCLGKTTTFSNTTKGGKWYSSNTAIAQIDSSTGIITGNTLGVAKILYVVASGVCPKTAIRDVTVSYTSPVTSYISLSGCNSLVYNGVTYSASTVKTDTIKSIGGCDSIYKIATITITKFTSTTTNFSVSGCNSVVYNGVTYNTSTIKRDTTKSIGGCDSIIKITTITVNKITPVTQNFYASGCNSVLYNGITYSTSAIHIDTIKSVQGCDSIYKKTTITVNNVTPVIQNLTINGCNSVLYNGVTYTSSTIHTDTVKSYQGCDSVYKIANIIVTKIAPTTINISINGCGSVVYNGITYTTSIVRTDTTKSIGGCDSLYKVATITINKIIPTTSTISISGCGSVVYKGVNYTTSGVITDTVKSLGGCDSIYKVVNITVIKFTANTINLSVSGCDSVVYNGITYFNSTIHTDTIRNTQGCDSVYKVVTITVNKITPTKNYINVSGCNSVIYNGQTYTTSAIRTDTIKSYQGCDSIYTIVNILVNTLNSFNPLQDTVSACGDSVVLDAGTGYSKYSWSSGDTTQIINVKQSGWYTVTVTNINGCTASDSSYIGIVKARILTKNITICKGSSATLSIDSVFSGSGITNKSQLPANLQNGLQAYYTFNGNANDISGNGNNGTVNGATLTSDRFGNPNGAYSFDGNGNYIIANSNDLTAYNEFTISEWTKYHNNVANYSAWSLMMSASNASLELLQGSNTIEFIDYDRNSLNRVIDLKNNVIDSTALYLVTLTSDKNGNTKLSKYMTKVLLVD